MVTLVVGDAHLPDTADTHNGALIFPRDLYKLPAIDNYEEPIDAYGAAGRMVSDFSMPTDVNVIGAILLYIAIHNANSVSQDITLTLDYLRVGYTDFTTYTTLAEITNTSITIAGVPAGGYGVGVRSIFKSTPVTIPAGTFLFYEYSGYTQQASVYLASLVDDPKYIMGAWVPIRYTV